MRTLLIILLATTLQAQVMKVDYFRTSPTSLFWETWVEDGLDTFSISKSIDGATWEYVATVSNVNAKSGAYYSRTMQLGEGVWYYRLKWTDGIMYATSTTRLIPEKDWYYNILGQKVNYK